MYENVYRMHHENKTDTKLVSPRPETDRDRDREVRSRYIHSYVYQLFHFVEDE